MDKLEAVRLALAECGEVAHDELVALVESRFGVKIEPKFLPLLKAILRDKELLLARQGLAATEVGAERASA
jgi:hypothetical protein